MHSYIICYGSENSRLKELNRIIASIRQVKHNTKDFLTSQDPDILILKPTPRITINSVRELKTWLQLKPFQAKCKIALISSANLLTLPAQHALLKTLEEPVANTFIILETENPHQLLPTIRSRCQIIRAQRSENASKDLEPRKIEIIVRALQKGSAAIRMASLKEFKNRKEAKDIMSVLLQHFRKKMRQDPTWAPAVKLAQETIESLDQNLNTSLALEHFALHFPKLKSSD